MDCGDRLLSVYGHYADQGVSLASAALAGAGEFRSWQHHPAHDAIDRANGTRFYYHAHDDEPPAFKGEHGHFHVFAQAGTERSADAAFVHLVAISIDRQGTPLGFFTTNGWVTGERHLALGPTLGLLKAFKLQVKGRLAPVARWIEALIGWQHPTIAHLIREREALLRTHPQGLKSAWNDKACHVTSRHALPHFWSSLIQESS
jgi:hypothetical protein